MQTSTNSKRPRFDARAAEAVIRGRMDADDTVFFLRQLESIDQRPYQVLFSGMLARKYIPDQDGVDPTANVYTWRMYERLGIGDVGGPNANDLPRASVVGGERSVSIKQIPGEYGWTLREIQQAAKVGTPLDMMLVSAAKRMIDYQQDQLLAFGDTTLGISGLYRMANVNSATASTKDTGGLDWTETTNTAQMLADINGILKSLRNQLKQAGDESIQFPEFRLLAPSNDYQIAAATPRSSTSDTTILKYALANNPWIEADGIYEWWRGDTASSTGKKMWVAFPPDPQAVSAVVPVEFVSLPPQPKGLGFNIPCYGSCGGVVNRYPVACQYMVTGT